MTLRLDYSQHVPELTKKLLELSTVSRKSGLEASLLDLVNIRASQLNGCAFCVDMHNKEAKMHGERELRLYHIAVWRESPLFSPRERAALAWAEATTQLGSHGVSEELYGKTREHFNDDELTALTFAVAIINAWNRLGVSFTPVPGSMDKAWGLDRAGLG